MNILILHASSDLYGSSKICWLEARKLKNSGHHVMVVLSERGPLTEVFENLGIEVLHIRLGVIRRKYLNPFGIINRICHIVHSIYSLNRVVKSNRINLIYSNTAAVLTGGLLARYCSLKSIYHLHEIFDPKNSVLHRILGKFINLTADKVIVVSDAVQKNWDGLLSQHKICKIYNGIPIEKEKMPSSSIREELKMSDEVVLLGMFGRVNRFKGQGYLLDIVHHLKEITSNFHLVFAGDAFPGDESLYEDFVNRITDENLGGYVTNLGYRNDIPQIMESLDIFVLPSIKPDPFPTVILEAMAASKPIIATYQGGAIEQVENGLTGFHIPLDDANEAATKIASLIENKSMRESMGKKGRERLKDKFSLEAFEKNINQLVESF